MDIMYVDETRWDYILVVSCWEWGMGYVVLHGFWGGDGGLEIGGRIMVVGLDRKGIGERMRIAGEH